jgi:hypothetical protein
MKIYSKEEAKSEITRLVDAFGQKIDFYKSDKYKEANLEDEYLKPFLRYLNWNTSNEGITNIANRSHCSSQRETGKNQIIFCN